MPETLVPNDLTESQLNRGYWFVTHKILLRRIFEAFLIVFSAIMLGFSGYELTLDIMSIPVRAQMEKSLATDLLNHAVAVKQAPQPLAVANVQILVPSGKYDFIGQIRNPNPKFAGRFSYRFVAPSFATEWRKGFVLPGEEKFIVELGVKAGARPANISLDIKDFQWQRITAHDIPDWTAFAAQHLNLAVTDVVYTPTIELTKGKPAIGRTSFTITNNTGYGYYDVPILVFMYRGLELVAANETGLSSLKPGESAPSEVTWFEEYDSVTDIKVIPQIDILNDKVYLRAGG